MNKYYVIKTTSQSAPNLIVPECERQQGSIELGAFLQLLKQRRGVVNGD